jgi:hypothetical protein
VHKNVPDVVKSGYGHLYMDVNNPMWQLSKVSLQEENHAIAYTLQQIYSNYKSKVSRGVIF